MGRRHDDSQKQVPPGKALVMSRRTAERLAALLERPDLEPDPVQFDQFTRAGKVFFRLKESGKDDEGRRAGRLRFTPYIGGADGTRLYFSPGTVSYCRVASEDNEASVENAGTIVVPVFPAIDGVRLDAEEPPFFDLSGRSGCSVWLKVDRTKCSNATFLPVEEESSEEIAEELVILGKSEKPAKEKTKEFRLVAKMDFETAGSGAKTIQGLDARIQSDVMVSFICEDEDDSGSEAASDRDGSSDFDSSDEEDDEDSGSSGAQKDCPWDARARWWEKQDCYKRNGDFNVIWRVEVGIKTLRQKCQKWEIHVSFPGGIPRPYAGQKAVGNSIVQPMNANSKIFGARFRFPDGGPQCTPVALSVRAVGTPDPEDSTPDECCTSLPAKSFPDRWPHWCGHSCATTAPPPPP